MSLLGTNYKLMCAHGHILADTRRRRSTGGTYCLECAKRMSQDRRRSRGIPKKSTHQDKPLNSRVSHLKRSYGLTIQQVSDLLSSQDNKCAICSTTNFKACIDHDHRTGIVRGILCRSCNIGLGFMKDDIDHLKSAIKYLEVNLARN